MTWDTKIINKKPPIQGQEDKKKTIVSCNDPHVWFCIENLCFERCKGIEIPPI